MDPASFALWKFRYIEGYLEGMHSYNVETTKYVDPDTLGITWIKYEISSDVATIESANATLKCKFSELEKTLKDLKMYRVLGENQRHSLAGPQNSNI